MIELYVKDSGFEYSLDYETEYYTDKADNYYLLTKQVGYVNYEMLCDLEKIIENKMNLSDQKVSEKVKKYLQKC